MRNGGRMEGGRGVGWSKEGGRMEVGRGRMEKGKG